MDGDHSLEMGNMAGGAGRVGLILKNAVLYIVAVNLMLNEQVTSEFRWLLTANLCFLLRHT